MTPTDAKKLDFTVCKIDVGAQKIDEITLATYSIAIASFLLQDKHERDCFFEKIFLLANTSMDVVLEMPFFALSNADVQFTNNDLKQRSYIVQDTLLIKKRVEIINQNKFVAAALEPKEKGFVVHIATLEVQEIDVHPTKKAQIAFLFAEKALEKKIDEYVDYADLFSPEFTTELPKHTRINNQPIDLEEAKQPPYNLIYSLELVELEILKTYIKANFKNSFI